MEETVLGDTVTILRDVEAEEATEYYVDGLRLLFSKPEFAEGNKARAVMEMLENRSFSGVSSQRRPRKTTWAYLSARRMAKRH